MLGCTAISEGNNDSTIVERWQREQGRTRLSTARDSERGRARNAVVATPCDAGSENGKAAREMYEGTKRLRHPCFPLGGPTFSPYPAKVLAITYGRVPRSLSTYGPFSRLALVLSVRRTSALYPVVTGYLARYEKSSKILPQDIEPRGRRERGIVRLRRGSTDLMQFRG